MFHVMCGRAVSGHAACDGAPQGSGCAYQVAFFFAIRSGHGSTSLFLASTHFPSFQYMYSPQLPRSAARTKEVSAAMLRATAAKSFTMCMHCLRCIDGRTPVHKFTARRVR